MSKFIRHERCPSCADRGSDRRGNNLGVYADGSLHCFSCGYHKAPDFRLNFLTTEAPNNDKEKAVLPSDFTRQIPAEGWRWLLQYQLPMSYWQAHCGYSPKDQRLVIRVGSPTRMSVGRFVGDKSLGASKWKVYGDKSSHVEIVGEQLSNPIVLVEDIISAHKVAYAGFTSIPLFGTNISDKVVGVLQGLKRPVVLWLDYDQWVHLAKKIGRLQSLLDVPVKNITTRCDPKECSVNEIKEILK